MWGCRSTCLNPRRGALSRALPACPTGQSFARPLFIKGKGPSTASPNNAVPGAICTINRKHNAICKNNRTHKVPRVLPLILCPLHHRFIFYLHNRTGGETTQTSQDDDPPPGPAPLPSCAGNQHGCCCLLPSRQRIEPFSSLHSSCAASGSPALGLHKAFCICPQPKP